MVLKPVYEIERSYSLRGLWQKYRALAHPLPTEKQEDIIYVRLHPTASLSASTKCEISRHIDGRIGR